MRSSPEDREKRRRLYESNTWPRHYEIVEEVELCIARSEVYESAAGV